MHDLKTALTGYFKKDVLLFLGLGLSCGAPLNLLAKTLSIWTTERGIDLKTIGLFSLILLPYSLRFLWAPLVDRFDLPLLARLGRKKAWGVVFQLGLMTALFCIALLDPAHQIKALFFCCLTAAFFAASQDIVVDALRIDTLTGDRLKEGSALYQFGYRMGLLLTGAGVIALSTYVPWGVCYFLSTALVVVGFFCLLGIQEPTAPAQSVTFRNGVLAPFADFMKRQHWALLVLFIILYKVCNAVLGRMADPFYLSNGFSKNEIALVSGAIGPWITMAGVIAGGFLMLRLNYNKSLLLLGLFEIFTSFAFALLAWAGPSLSLFLAVIVFDNIIGGMGGAVFVAFLSALCSKAYSATQYALLSSLTMFSVSVVASQSGVLAQALGWEAFFILTGFLMLPALGLLLYLMKETTDER